MQTIDTSEFSLRCLLCVYVPSIARARAELRAAVRRQRPHDRAHGGHEPGRQLAAARRRRWPGGRGRWLRLRSPPGALGALLAPPGEAAGRGGRGSGSITPPLPAAPGLLR